MVSFSIFHQPPHFLPKTQFFPLLFLLLSSTAASIDTGYSQYCNDVVPEYPLSPLRNPDFTPLRLDHARVSGGESLLINPGNSTRSLNFNTHGGFITQNPDVFKLEATLTLRSISNISFIQRGRGLRLVHYRPPRFPLSGGSSRRTFFLVGFWNSVSGKLCMTGSSITPGSPGRYGPKLRVVLKLDYANSSDIYTSVVNGTLESLDKDDDRNAFFDTISILGMNRRFYKYTLIEKEREENVFDHHLHDAANASLGSDISSIVKVISMVRGVDLKYMSDCNKVNCDFLGVGRRPNRMFLFKIDHSGKDEEGNVRFLLVAGDSYRWRMPLEPSLVLVSEGKWEKEKRRLDMVGCRISNGEEGKGLVGDCSVRLSLRMPSKWSLRERNAIVGEMWSSKGVNESGYFGLVEMRSKSNSNAKDGGLTYEYTEIENVRKSCQKDIIHKGKGGKYPGVLSSDMRFDMVVTDKKGKTSWPFGYSSPLTVGDEFYQQMRYYGWGSQMHSEPQEIQINGSMVNVSFVLSFKGYDNIRSMEISAEGLYDPNSGKLCMIGCKYDMSPGWQLGNKNASVDCDIIINIQYASLDVKRGSGTKGIIESKRNKSDPLYFEPLHISSRSIYEGQARDSIWRMDIEITMVLISNTLVCVFVGLQLFYVSKNQAVLPSISVLMLVVLSLGHMIPLLLNFEALFLANRNRQNLYFGTDGWLEVNEVLVRVITMIAFLLEFRLLQITWSARNEDSEKKSLWISDRKVFYVSLPLYISGWLIAWFAHLSSKSYQRSSFGVLYSTRRQQTLWEGLKSYAGLILDGFLLPQILFNIISDSKEKALTPSFYVGTTIVRLLPHAYDLFRAHSPTWSFSYIYANPRTGYYSTGWDIIISGGGLVFVLLIFLQQRLGGRCFLPARFRQSSVYEKVPAISNESL